MDHIETLKKGLELCILKPADKERSSSLAITKGGREYLGALIGSDTNLMNISSEQTALMLSTSSRDFPVQEVITMVENPEHSISPIVVKIMADYVSRTQSVLKYRIISKEGQTIFESEDITKIFPLYNPSPVTIAKTSEQYAPNYEEVSISEEEMPAKLKEYALKGMGRNFSLYDSASSYGTAVYTRGGKVYFAGQYSSPDKRLNLHSEMTAIISALMARDKEIEAIGIVSSKYPDSPCNMCGSCRQFISEITFKLNISPDLYCFSSNSSEFKKTNIKEYLPDSWSSKKW